MAKQVQEAYIVAATRTPIGRSHRGFFRNMRPDDLLAETATGMAVGMNVRDDCLPLAKELSMAFKKRATGALKAVATLTAEQRAAMQASDKGEVQVKVTVTDETGAEPVQCEFTWAWIPSSRPKN